MPAKNLHRYKTNTLEMTEDNIVCFRSEADDVYTDKDLIEILTIAEKIADHKPFLLLMVIDEFDFLMTNEARSLFNTYAKAIQFIKAEAVVVKSIPTKIMYNLVTMLHAPKFPLKAFRTEKEAIKWLLQYK